MTDRVRPNVKLQAALMLLAVLAPAMYAAAQQGMPLPETPRATGRILYAEPVVLDTPFVNRWRAEKPEAGAGWLLVLEVEKQYVVPRQTAQPVLYAGRETAMRFNVGFDAGRLVVFVPSRLTETGALATTPRTMRIWFGEAELPERIDAEAIERERTFAIDAGIGPRPEEEVVRLKLRRDRPSRVADRSALDRRAAVLIREWVPEEAELAELMLAPPPGG